jgi:hypothetical protein
MMLTTDGCLYTVSRLGLSKKCSFNGLVPCSCSFFFVPSFLFSFFFVVQVQGDFRDVGTYFLKKGANFSLFWCAPSSSFEKKVKPHLHQPQNNCHKFIPGEFLFCFCSIQTLPYDTQPLAPSHLTKP